MVGIKYQIYAFSSDVVKSQEKFLSHTLNKGYNVPRFQYNVITTPRIKHSISEDLCVTPADKCYAIFCFADVDANAEGSVIEVNPDECIDDAVQTRSKFLQLYTTLNPTLETVEYDITTGHADGKNLQFPDKPANKLLGMGCLKPHPTSSKAAVDNESSSSSSSLSSAYELTGFVSFYPRVGSKLILQCEKFAKECLSAKQVWITAIGEHELSGMYEKWGYKLVETVLVPLSAAGDVEDCHLENDIGASQDFHLDVMVKDL
jgi:hypothetical protein